MVDVSEWLLVSASTAKSTTLRVFVWRQLRRLGAVHLGPSVCLVPKLPTVSEAVTRMVNRVSADGGRARVFVVTLTAEDAEQVMAEQRADRDREYAEVLDRVPAFLAEIEMETERGRATYTEVEESEADLGRFERWLDSIRSRDYFDAPGSARTVAAVEGCRAALADFEAKAVVADTALDEDRLAADDPPVKGIT
ncbi:Chromate resistance protein ChrB [Microlunatus ginsengisoli]|uniref:ChrB N-terminal domain-containing protein n=1 Tax=Microlunatus ginsengisoli TaxID=363863 RepID=A0ABP7AQH2_9ACTN